MKVAIMQPYFFPYLGYFQLIDAVEKFIIYDDIQYVKQSWINRNRILVNGEPSLISLPLKKDSDFLNVNQRELSPVWSKERNKLRSRIQGAYRKAPYFAETYELVDRCLTIEEENLFDFLFGCLKQVLDYLGITTPVFKSSSVCPHGQFKAQDKVLELCRTSMASTYINAIGGVELYSHADFEKNGIMLRFLQSMIGPYRQWGDNFLSHLSIIDVLMFNGLRTTSERLLPKYELIK